MFDKGLLPFLLVIANSSNNALTNGANTEVLSIVHSDHCLIVVVVGHGGGIRLGCKYELDYIFTKTSSHFLIMLAMM